MEWSGPLSISETIGTLTIPLRACSSFGFLESSWMTLRWHSTIPAGITYTVSDILIVSRATEEVPWNYQILIALWGAVAFLLFRFWPLAQAQPVETGLSAPDPASAI